MRQRQNLQNANSPISPIDSNNNNDSNNKDINKIEKTRMRKIFTTQSPQEHNRDKDRSHRHHRGSRQQQQQQRLQSHSSQTSSNANINASSPQTDASSSQPRAPNSSRGYIVHGKHNNDEAIANVSNTTNTNTNTNNNTNNNDNNNTNIAASPKPNELEQQTQPLKSSKQQHQAQQYQNVRKITKEKKYRFISPLFILEVWHEKHAVMDQNHSNNNNEHQQQSRASSYYNRYPTQTSSGSNGHVYQYIQYDIGNFYTLSLNLDAIVHSWGSARDRQLPLLNFLLNRETYQSKRIILKMLFEMIHYYCLGYKYDVRSKLDCISEYFFAINKVLRRAVEESTIMFSFLLNNFN